MAHTWLTKARICHAQSNCDKAEALAKKALGAVAEALGTEHPLAGEVYCVLGQFYTEDERYEEAERACRRAIDIYSHHMGEENDNTANAMNVLARVLIRQGRLAEAEDLCVRALTILADIFESDHPRVFAVHETMGELHGRLSRWDGFVDASSLLQ
jgi:tetratricopeptide (TPR) repeat protein